MTLTIPCNAEFLTVEFALPEGGAHRQRVAIWGLRGSHRLVDVISKAVAGAKRNRKKVANVLSITHKKTLLFSYMADTTRGFR